MRQQSASAGRKLDETRWVEWNIYIYQPLVFQLSSDGSAPLLLPHYERLYPCSVLAYPELLGQGW